ncbi:hypothetical protein Tco_1204288 [Tanacetum coccineum]
MSFKVVRAQDKGGIIVTFREYLEILGSYMFDEMVRESGVVRLGSGAVAGQDSEEKGLHWTYSVTVGQKGDNIEIVLHMLKSSHCRGLIRDGRVDKGEYTTRQFNSDYLYRVHCEGVRTGNGNRWEWKGGSWGYRGGVWCVYIVREIDMEYWYVTEYGLCLGDMKSVRAVVSIGVDVKNVDGGCWEGVDVGVWSGVGVCGERGCSLGSSWVDELCGRRMVIDVIGFRGVGKIIVDLDMPEDIKVPLILGRPFLSTARAKIDVYKRKNTLRVGKEKIIFKSVKSASRALMNVLIFVGTFSVVTDFAVLEDMDAYCDEGMGDVIVGEPDPNLFEFHQWKNISHAGTLACIRWNGERKLKTSLNLKDFAGTKFFLGEQPGELLFTLLSSLSSQN